MISVICTTYNMAEYLRRCITSIINQTYKDTEIIIVDDASTDNTAEILSEFQQCTIITQPCNTGHSEARNCGLAHAHGEYFYFIDADDYIHPQTLELLMDNMTATNADISIGNFIRHDELPDILNNRFRVYTSHEALKTLTRYDGLSIMDKRQVAFTATWNKIFKRELFDDIKFPSGHVRDDNFTAHRLFAKADKVVYSSAITYFYTYKEHSMSSDQLYANRDLMLAFQDRIKFFEENGLTQYLPDTNRRYKDICIKTYRCMRDYSIVEEAQLNIKKIIIYIQSTRNSGVITWVNNFKEAMSDFYHIEVLTKADMNVLHKCNILLFNYGIDDIPENIQADKTYVILHCDYASLSEEYKFDKTRKYIAVSEVTAKGMREKYGLDCIAVEGLLMKKPQPQRVYKFISSAHPAGAKGMSRICKLARLLKDRGIMFQWLVFYDKDILSIGFKPKYPELIISNTVPHDEFVQYIKDADYVVQLSDNGEGFCCTIHEALLVGTPVLVTDIPVFRVVKNGYNGYKLPLDMEGIDIDAILSKIPKGFYYNNQYETIYNKWRTLL